MKNIIISLKYLWYYFRAQTSHDIHSPFVFNLVTKAINNREENPAFMTIEKIRKKMISSKEIVTIRDFGAGFGGHKFKKLELKFIAANSSKSTRYCKLIYSIVAYLKPSTMLELGTSLGISAMYQAAGCMQAHFTTIEGCPNTAKLAMNNFKTGGFEKINVIVGDFTESLPVYLKEINMLDYVFIDGNHKKEPVLKYFQMCLQKTNNNSFMIIDDINWSAEMQEAWQEIKLHPSVSVTIDFFMMGVVFFNPDFTKQDFMIRF